MQSKSSHGRKDYLRIRGESCHDPDFRPLPPGELKPRLQEAQQKKIQTGMEKQGDSALSS